MLDSSDDTSNDENDPTVDPHEHSQFSSSGRDQGHVKVGLIRGQTYKSPKFDEFD